MPAVEGDIVVDFPRPPRRWRPVLLGGCVVLATAAAWLPLVASGGPRDGVQVVANATTDGTQQSPKVAALPDGKVVVVWAGQGTDDDSGIYARIRDPQTGFGDEFRVNETTDGDQVEPAVAADGAGDFLVAWTGPSRAVDNNGDPVADRGTDVFTRLYDKTGTALRGEQRLNAAVTGDQSQPSVAVSATRQFDVAFAGAGEEAPPFGTPAASDDHGIWMGITGDETYPFEYLVNRPATDGAQQHPAIAVNGTTVAVAWDGAGPGDDDGVFATSASEAPFPAPVRLNTTTDGHQGNPAIAAKPGGGFLAAWAGKGLADDDGILFAQVGTNTETPVNTVTDGVQDHPAITVAGNFVCVAWDGNGAVDASGVEARRWNFSVSLQPAAAPFAVNTSTGGAEQHPALAADAGGDYTVAFEGPSNDGDVYVRHYAFNDPPVVVDDFYNTEEDTPFDANVLTNDSDPDGDTITVTQETGQDAGPDNGQVDLRPDGSFTYTPNKDYHGADHFSYRASDGTTDSVRVADVSITVISVNDGGPTANPDPYTVAEHTTLRITDRSQGVLANDTDPDRDPLTARLRTQPTSGELTLNDDGTFSYTGGPNFCHQDYFTYVAFDGYVESAPARVTIDVTCVPSPPQARDDQYTTDEDADLSVPPAGVLQNDFHESDDPVVAKALDPPSNGTLVSFNDDGSFLYRPKPNFHGTDSFTYEVVSTKPPPSQQQQQSPPAPGSPLAGDVGQTAGDALAAAGATSTSTSTSTTTTTAPPSPEPPSIAHVTIEVGSTADAPLVGDDAAFTPEDTLLTVPAPGVLGNDTDPDQGQLTAEAGTPPSNGTLDLKPDGSYTYQPYRGFNDTDFFTYTVRNGAGRTATGRVKVLVGPQGDVIVATDDVYQVREGASLTVPAPGVLSNDVDPGGDPAKLTVTVVRQPAHGTLLMNQDGSFLYAAAAGYRGVDGFGYKIADPTNGNTATANAVITVVASNGGPVETTPTTLPGPAATTPPPSPDASVSVVTSPPSTPSPAAAAPVVPITVPTTAPPPPTVAVLPARRGGGGKFPVVPVGAGVGGGLALAGLAGGLHSRRRNVLGPIEHSPL